MRGGWLPSWCLLIQATDRDPSADIGPPPPSKLRVLFACGDPANRWRYRLVRPFLSMYVCRVHTISDFLPLADGVIKRVSTYLPSRYFVVGIQSFVYIIGPTYLDRSCWRRSRDPIVRLTDDLSMKLRTGPVHTMYST